jgi:glyoxylase-like metal-dependent hydrolase (beta-lactamase superfamily II)
LTQVKGVRYVYPYDSQARAAAARAARREESMHVTLIGEEFYHIKSAEEILHRNIYIKRFVGRDGAEGVMVFDPGSKADAAAVWEALEQVAGGVENVDLVFLSHQDPDVASNAKFLVDSAPRATVLASVDSWRLLNMLGIPDTRFYLVESWGGEPLHLRKTGHLVQPVPAHYCHFRGSTMLYDPESRVLFSGDFLGGVNTRAGEGIYADETSWAGISLFHQIYMPAKRAVQETIGRILELKPFPEVIAPQHGDVLQGAYITEFLSRLAKLDVGVDLVKLQDPEREAGLAAFNAFFAQLATCAPEAYDELWKEINRSQEFTSLFDFSRRKITDVKVSVGNAVVYLCNTLDKVIARPERDQLKLVLLVELEDRGLRVPSFCLLGSGVKAGILEAPA